MKQRIYIAMVIAFAVATAFSVFAVRSVTDMRSECQQALANFKNADPTLQGVLDSSAGYAVFPSVGKGALVIGGAHGKGCVFENGKAIGQAWLSQATIGAQIGGQSFSELIVFQTSAALNHFKSSNLELSAGVSAVAAQEGASKVAKYDEGVAVFTLAKAGLMVEASVGGQKLTFEPVTWR